MKVMKSAALAAAISISTASLAAPLTMYPVQTGAETERFQRGVPTVTLELPSGAIVVTPLPFDHGSMSLGLAVYNKGGQPANFGIENIVVMAGDEPLSVFSVDQLESKAKNRAMWSAIGVAMLAGAAAAAASQAHNTNSYRSVTRTPWGTVSHVAQWRDNTPGIIGATAATAAGVAGVVGIQNRLAFTLENLATDIVQTTTIDPDASYGGRIVLSKPAKAKPPFDVKITVAWNGATFPFTFRVTPAGTNVPPPFTTVPTALPELTAPGAPVAAGGPTAGGSNTGTTPLASGASNPAG
jgi:hypothetical protein